MLMYMYKYKDHEGNSRGGLLTESRHSTFEQQQKGVWAMGGTPQTSVPDPIRIRIRIRINRILMFLGLPDPDPSIIKQK